ncbi:MAG: 50S ribosome-binding GTPase [Phycisphaerales bacterium]|nr:50S ribosome-binding GTPase [Phycisphaerales bacterium]
MSREPIRLAVIGHTNTGKTSVLRTLLRDASLGEVADAPGTTRQSRRYALALDGEEVAVFWDTPGLENAALALEHLRRVEQEQSLSGARRSTPCSRPDRRRSSTIFGRSAR